MFQMKKRLSNVTYYGKAKKRRGDGSSSGSSSSSESVDDKDLEKHHAELLKQIRKRSINNDAVRELQKLTFKGRWAFISALEKDPIQATVSEFPYMCNEVVVSVVTSCLHK